MKRTLLLAALLGTAALPAAAQTGAPCRDLATIGERAECYARNEGAWRPPAATLTEAQRAEIERSMATMRTDIEALQRRQETERQIEALTPQINQMTCDGLSAVPSERAACMDYLTTTQANRLRMQNARSPAGFPSSAPRE